MAKVLVHHYDGDALARRPDQLIVEEPLEIHLDGALVSTTMRTPGHDFELAAGFCFTEGLLAGAPVRQCKYCGTGSAVDSEFNVVTVDTGGRAPVPTPRLTLTTSACGMCGTTAVDDLRERLHPLPPRPPFALDVLARLPDSVVGDQELFAATGAVHAAVAFDRTGAPVLARSGKPTASAYWRNWSRSSSPPPSARCRLRSTTSAAQLFAPISPACGTRRNTRGCFDHERRCGSTRERSTTRQLNTMQ